MATAWDILAAQAGDYEFTTFPVANPGNPVRVCKADARRVYLSFSLDAGASLYLAPSTAVTSTNFAVCGVGSGWRWELSRGIHGDAVTLEWYATCSAGNLNLGVCTYTVPTLRVPGAGGAGGQTRCRDPRTGNIVTRGSNGR